MCGIAGMFGKNATEEAVNSMLEKISHRGRDERRTVACGKFILGFNRLAIVSLGSEGSQPLENDHRIVAFNGELYNYDESFQSEVRWLADLMDRISEYHRVLDGQFFIVTYHKKTGLLKMIRDPWGICPGYFSINGGGDTIKFGSEKKIFEPGEKIIEVSPGTIVTIRTNPKSFIGGETRDLFSQVSSEKYFVPVLNNIPFNYTVYEKMFINAVLKIARHTDVPVSLALGGLDSTLILKICLDFDVKLSRVYTIGFGNDSTDVHFAEKLADEWGFELNVRIFEKDEILAELPRIKYMLDDRDNNPVKLVGMLRNYFVSMASDSKVILCGEGADELFYGYPFFPNFDGFNLAFRGLKAMKGMHRINLDRVDRGGMAWTREFRPIYIDKSLSLLTLQFERHPEKVELKRVANGIWVPDYVISRPKYGTDEKFARDIITELKNENA